MPTISSASMRVRRRAMSSAGGWGRWGGMGGMGGTVVSAFRRTGVVSGFSRTVEARRTVAVRSVQPSLVALFLTFVVCPMTGRAQTLPTAIPQTKFDRGQDIQPYFEGWIRNADGSFDMVFGYFNRNWQEELAIPAGPDNMIDPFDSAQGRPGGPDRGQPTYFLPRRQGWVYR